MEQNPYHNSLSINIDVDQPTAFLDTRLLQQPPQDSSFQQDMGIARFTQKRHSPSLDNLFSNRDVLARRLKNRPDRDDLVDRNIIPAHAHAATPAIFNKVAQLERKKTGDFLTKKIRARPSRQQLIQRHILSADSRVDPSLLEKVGKLERQRIADQLNERLLQRPGPIELIQDRILPVESPIQNAIDQGSVDYQQTVSPASSHADSPSVSELETGIHTLNCTSPSPPPPPHSTPQVPPLPNNFSDVSFKNQLKTVSESGKTANPLFVSDSFKSSHSISLSQRENERLVKSVNKKTRQQKPKVKKLKFHECLPGSGTVKKVEVESEVVDERYQRLLEQQTLYLRLQVMQQNAVMNALQGNPESMDQVNEEIEHMMQKENNKTNDTNIKSIDGKKLDDLRVVDLRAQLKHRGLLVSGAKAKLIERLLAFEEGKSTPADFAYSGSNLSHDASIVASKTTSTMIPSTTVMQVATYATNSGQTYQVVQTVPQSSPSIMQYQVVPATSSSDEQLSRLDQVNTVPVMALTQPSVMSVQERVSDKPLRAQATPSPSHIQFHITPPPQPQTPTIVLHSGPPLQQASLYQRQRQQKVKVQKLPVISQGQCFDLSESNAQPLGLSQSVPPMQLNNNYLMEANQCNLNYNTSLSNSSLHTDVNADNDLFNNPSSQFRGRASSEPASQLKKMHPLKSDSTKSVFSHQQQDLSLQFPKMSPSPSPSLKDHHQLPNSIKSENMDDIMDIIGELSSSPGLMKEPPPPYNSCYYDNKKLLTEQKPFNTSDAHDLNLLSGSPSQNFLNNSFYNTAGFNTSSSTGSIPQQTSPTPFRGTSPSHFMNTAALSPTNATTDDPMELDRFPSPNMMASNNSLNWLDLNMEPNSPNMNFQTIKDNNTANTTNSMNMDLQNGMFSNELNNQQQTLYNNQNRQSQNSLFYGSSPRQQDGFISLFDLEGGEY